MASKKRKASDPAMALADAVAAPFGPRFAELAQYAEERRDKWSSMLMTATHAAALSNEELRLEGRQEACRRYDESAVQHFWPDPPSIVTLTTYSVRDEAEAAFFTDLEAFCASVAAAKTVQLALVQAAKSATPPDVENVRRLGRGIGALSSLMQLARELDKPVRERVQIASRRIPSYRESCAIRSLPADFQLVDVPPSRAGYEQVLDFYRFTDVGIHSFGRASEGPQFFTDIRRNVLPDTLEVRHDRGQARLTRPPVPMRKTLTLARSLYPHRPPFTSNLRICRRR